MALRNKSRLRNTLKKLSSLALGDDDPHASAQEALDFLSMMAGKKPVMILGRGYNEQEWIKGVLQIAAELKLHTVEGPFWDASADSGAGSLLPRWYLDHTRAAFAEYRAWYICRARDVAKEVAEICETEVITVEQEARLLNYPECCVRAHYDRAANYQGIWLDLLRRKADGDEVKAMELLAGNQSLDPETDEDLKRLEVSMRTISVPFTSINACDACVDGGPDAPANVKSLEGRELARVIDEGLLRALG
ncbi:MAG: hypothetical protein CFH41_00030 [Alphaproteobacteria bacterium MarineAlpha11_Bin1]|nr:MAG: hypothetical protein CFH41_00030 [Alphaproteobacteria bacterium MarineAlpha11_Bin1]|tara:strand:+ start:707 stop:1453 length:747 start_codon:yes stop_codon:yes gene_type:complete